MATLEHFRLVDECHRLKSKGYSVEVIALWLDISEDAVRLIIESSPVGYSPHG